MHSLGEEMYRQWHVERIRETPITLYLFCLAGNTLLTAGVGAALIYFSNLQLMPFAIGTGMVAYAAAVAFYTLLAIWRIRRAAKKLEARQNSAANTNNLPAATWVRVEESAPDKII